MSRRKRARNQEDQDMHLSRENRVHMHGHGSDSEIQKGFKTPIIRRKTNIWSVRKNSDGWNKLCSWRKLEKLANDESMIKFVIKLQVDLPITKFWDDRHISGLVSLEDKNFKQNYLTCLLIVLFFNERFLKAVNSDSAKRSPLLVEIAYLFTHLVSCMGSFSLGNENFSLVNELDQEYEDFLILGKILDDLKSTVKKQDICIEDKDIPRIFNDFHGEVEARIDNFIHDSTSTLIKTIEPFNSIKILPANTLQSALDNYESNHSIIANSKSNSDDTSKYDLFRNCQKAVEFKSLPEIIG